MRRGIAATLAASAALALIPASAGATFHLMKITEVAPNPGAPGTAFIELQMYAPGQNFVSGHPIRLYDADGGTPVTTFSFPAGVPNGDNQRTILIGDDSTAGPPDLLNSQLQDAFNLPPASGGAGGAVCFDTVDCVSWGNFTGGASLTSPAGTPAPAIPIGSSLTRSIAPGCATLLEDADDTNVSASDFSLAAPSPRNNATAPTETGCTGGGDTDPPQTEITKEPKAKTTKAKAKFKFRSDETYSDFMCKLDKGGFEKCSSPFKEKVDPGKHKFSVFAIDRAGNEDPSPAKAKFKRVER
ncbi:MAG: hypothetical protein ABWZ43_02520 [Solirubrobacterales bacterium]